MTPCSLLITATDTGVGKTTVTAALAHAYETTTQRHATVWKPVQSGTEIGAVDADSFRLFMGSGTTTQREQDIVTYSFPDPVAPWMAAQRQQTTIDYELLVQTGQAMRAQADAFFVEGAGGLAVPLTADRTYADLARDLSLAVLIVARPQLGTVNHTMLTIEYARKYGLSVIGVIVNGIIDPHDRLLTENIRMIETMSSIPVIGRLPWVEEPIPQGMNEWNRWRDKWSHIIQTNAQLSYLFGGT